MTTMAHAALAVLATLSLARALAQPWVDALVADEAARDALRWGLPALALAGSALAIFAGPLIARAKLALAADTASLWLFLALAFTLSLAPLSREAIGALFACALVARLAFPVWVIARGSLSARLVFGVALVAYGASALWLTVASAPFGDQVHYLLVADRLAQGHLDAAIDPALFRALIGVDPSAADAATHVVETPLGPRPVQGYALSALLAPGWMLAGRLGAHLVAALVAALAAAQALLLLCETIRSRRLAGATWCLVALLPPMLLVAPSLYPNALGALLVVLGYRWAFTAPTRRPVLAAAALAATLLLTPRDGLLGIVLLPFVWRAATDRRATVLAAGAVALFAVLANGLLYGLPLPYAGYLAGTLQAQTLTGEPSLSPRVWVALPAILFDRTFGVAAVAPFLFFAVLGLGRAWRAAELRPALVATGASLAALSVFRYWEGGYAPPARYLVETLPLLAPVLAFGLARASRWWPARALVAITVATSAVTALVLTAIPTRALNSAFDDQIRDGVAGAIGLDPLGWLPNFQPITPDWYLGAYARLLPALAVAALLVWLGLARAPRAWRGPPWPVAYALTVGALMVLALAAAAQPFVTEDVAASLLRRWLPFTLALGTALCAALASALRPPVRTAVLLASLVPFGVVPVALLLLRGTPAPANGHLGALYALAIGAFALVALFALWRAAGDISPDRAAGGGRRHALGDRAVAVGLGAVVLAVGLMVLPYHRTVMPTASDEPHYLLIVQSLLYDGDLDLRNDYEGDRYRAFYPARLPDMHGIEVGSAVYPIRDLGLPVLALGPFALAGRDGVLALLCVVAALLAVQTFLLLRDLGFRPRVALAAVAATSLTHPLLTYTTQIYPELPTALVFVTIARVLARGPDLRPRDLALASALTALLPALSTRAWLIALGIGLVIAYWAFRARGGRLVARLAAGALPFVAGVAVLSAIDLAMFGVFLPSAGYFLIREQQQVLSFAPQVGALGLLFDRVFGLVGRTPLYLIGLLGAFALLRRARAAHGAAVATLALGWGAYFLYIASIAYWWADGSPPSRYLVASLPFLVVAVASGLEVASRRTWTRALALGLGAASAFVTLVYTVLPNIRYDLALDIRATGASGALWPVIGRVVRPEPGIVFPSLVRIDLSTWALAALWVAVAVVLVLAGRTAVRSSNDTR